MPHTAVIAGVGPGLGASLARRFADEGCGVGLLARSTDYVEDLAANLREATSGDATAVTADITDPEQVVTAFGSVRESLGPVDVLVNNASDAPWAGVDVDPDAIADSYWHLVEQDRSSWTLELDLRPHVEEF